MNAKRTGLAVLGYIVVTFLIAAPWHLVLFKGLYDELAIYTREQPIIALGMMSMIIQAVIYAVLFPRYYRGGSPTLEGAKFGLLMGIFLASGTVIAEGAKQQVTSLPTWLILEGGYYLLQFVITGGVFGGLYGGATALKSRAA